MGFNAGGEIAKRLDIGGTVDRHGTGMIARPARAAQGNAERSIGCAARRGNRKAAVAAAAAHRAGINSGRVVAVRADGAAMGHEHIATKASVAAIAADAK